MTVNVNVIPADNSIEYPKLFKNKKTGSIAMFTSQYNCIILVNRGKTQFSFYDFLNCLRPVWKELPKGTQIILTQS